MKKEGNPSWELPPSAIPSLQGGWGEGFLRGNDVFPLQTSLGWIGLWGIFKRDQGDTEGSGSTGKLGQKQHNPIGFHLKLTGKMILLKLCYSG